MRKLKDGDQIKNVIEPVELGEMMASVGTLIPVMREILDDVHRLTSGPISDIANNVDEMIATNSEMLESLLNRVDHIAGNIDSITTSEADDVKQSIKNVREITESIKALVGTTHEQIAKTGEGARGSIDKLQGSIDNLEKSMKNMETVTSRIEKGEGTVGRLLSDDTIARNVEEITEDAGGFIQQHHPPADHRRPAHRVQLPHQHLQELPGDHADAPARQVLSHRAGRGSARLPDQDRDGRGQQLTARPAVGNQGHADRAAPVHLAVRQADRDRPNLAIGGRFGIKESTGGVAGDLYLFQRSAAAVGRRVRRQGQPFPAHQGDDVVRDLAAEPVRGRGRRRHGELRAGGRTAARCSITSLVCSSCSTTRICARCLLFGGGAAAGAASK